MINHISLGCHKFEEAIRFYSDCFLPLGYQLEHRTPEEAAFGPRGKWLFWLYPVAPSESIVGERCHIAVNADNREADHRSLRGLLQNLDCLSSQRPAVDASYGVCVRRY
jgi:catechol 2,3-dioxygenase-like lactoylglutathione lyase family enzyme